MTPVSGLIGATTNLCPRNHFLGFILDSGFRRNNLISLSILVLMKAGIQEYRRSKTQSVLQKTNRFPPILLNKARQNSVYDETDFLDNIRQRNAE